MNSYDQWKLQYPPHYDFDDDLEPQKAPDPLDSMCVDCGGELDWNNGDMPDGDEVCQDCFRARFSIHEGGL